MFLTRNQFNILGTIKTYEDLANRIMDDDFIDLRKLGLITSNIGAPTLTPLGREMLSKAAVISNKESIKAWEKFLKEKE